MAAAGGRGDVADISKSSSVTDSESDSKPTASDDESNEDVLETLTTITELRQSHAVLGTGGIEPSGFETSGELNLTSTGPAATMVTFQIQQQDDTAQLLPQQIAVCTFEEEIATRRRIRIVWLIILGSTTFLFCFPFGLFGLFFAGMLSVIGRYIHCRRIMRIMLVYKYPTRTCHFTSQISVTILI